MRRAKTRLGERLTEHAPRPCVGQVWKRGFREREVACPRCGAAPHRRCTSVEGDTHIRLTKAQKALVALDHFDQLGRVRYVDGLRPGDAHHARGERARLLTNYALRGLLPTLAYRPPRPRSTPPRRLDTTDLPLFATVEAPC